MSMREGQIMHFGIRLTQPVEDGKHGHRWAVLCIRIQPVQAGVLMVAPAIRLFSIKEPILKLWSGISTPQLVGNPAKFTLQERRRLLRAAHRLPVRMLTNI